MTAGSRSQPQQRSHRCSTEDGTSMYFKVRSVCMIVEFRSMPSITRVLSLPARNAPDSS